MLKALPEKVLAAIAAKIIREGRMPAPGKLNDALVTRPGPDRVRLSMAAGGEDRKGFVSALNSTPSDGTAAGAFADHLQEHAIPGAHIVREHAKQMREGRKYNPTTGTPNSRMTTLPLIYLTPEPTDEGNVVGVNQSLASRADKTAPVVQVLAEGGVKTVMPDDQYDTVKGAKSVYLTAGHRPPDAENRSGVYPSGVKVESWAHLEHLIQDFPAWAKASVRQHVADTGVKLKRGKPSDNVNRV